MPTDAAVPLRKCIATVALSGTLRDKLEACAAVGFDGVEIMEADLLTFEGSPADVRHICDDLGLTDRDLSAVPRLRSDAGAAACRAIWIAPNASSM